MRIVKLNVQTDTERRFTPAAWLVLIFCASLVLASAVQVAYRLTLPTDGWTYETGDYGGEDEGLPTYLVYLLDEPTLLQPGDQVLAAGERPIYLETPRPLTPPEGWAAGQTILYTVRRDGQQLALPVTLQHWTARAVWRYAVLDIINLGWWSSSAALLAIGLLVMLQRPGVPAAFGAALRDDAYADLDPLARRLLAVVEETMQPESATLWLRPPPRR